MKTELSEFEAALNDDKSPGVERVFADTRDLKVFLSTQNVI